MSETALLLYCTTNLKDSPYGWFDMFSPDDSPSASPMTDNSYFSDTLRTVSYKELCSVIELLCPIFSEYILKAQGGIENINTQPVIGISISEGPYLVIAVLLVHMLACHCQEVQSSPGNTRRSHGAPIIVPLDPNEATERLSQMISDANPCIVLVASIDGDGLETQSDDFNKVCGLVNSLKSSSSDSISSIFPLILSMKSLVREALTRQKEPLLRRDIFKLDDPPKALNRYVRSTNRQDSLIDMDEHDDLLVNNCISHIVFTSGTTGRPKGCISSLYSLWNYIHAKNISHAISTSAAKHDISPHTSIIPHVLLASALSFDPCLSDIIATYYAKATLVIASRQDILHNLSIVLQISRTTHVLCTPSLWNTLTPLVHSRKEAKTQFPCLKVVALGGEPISRRIVSLWAAETSSSNNFKLLATYGVTEACVYQTAGEIFCKNVSDEPEKNPDDQRHVGQDVGDAFLGTTIRICKEFQDFVQPSSVPSFPCRMLVDVDPTLEHECGLLGVGEVVLSGCQIDEYSSYLNLPQLSREKFVQWPTSQVNRDFQYHYNSHPGNSPPSRRQLGEYFYRTGDRACFDSSTGHLRILGRINGEEGLIKYNGVRIELGEIENAIQDPLVEGQTKRVYTIIERCVVVCKPRMDDSSERNHLWAYCILSSSALHELGLTFSSFESIKNHGILCTPSPLLTLLRNRCRSRVRMGITPSSFVIISTIPLTPTGKCNYKALPVCFEPSSISSQMHDSCSLFDYGRCGMAVANEIVLCLNIQPKHKFLVTIDSSFAMLGGDSLAATRVVRGLYALHHGIDNVRTLGGAFGTLEGSFNVSHLLNAINLGKYVDFLDKEGILPSKTSSPVDLIREDCLDDISTTKASYSTTKIQTDLPSPQYNNETHSNDLIMYHALYEASTRNQTAISLALLNEGADPNINEHGNRLGKISGGRLAQKDSFRSNPLHIACLLGNRILVDALLNYGCNCKSPDANGQFPIHLACSGPSSSDKKWRLSNTDETSNRIACVCSLLAKVPLTIRNSSKQTILHCAARSGYTDLLKFILGLFCEDTKACEALNWYDHWKRTAIHWAILNSNFSALQLLLKYGCNPNPSKHRASRSGTSGAIESPIEMSVRIHGINSDFTALLSNATNY